MCIRDSLCTTETGTFGWSTLLVFGRRRGRAPRAQPHLPAPQSGRRSTTQLFPSCNIRGPKRKNKKSLRCRHLQRTEKTKPCRHEGKQPEQFFAATRACRFSAKARTLWKFLSGSVSDIKKWSAYLLWSSQPRVHPQSLMNREMWREKGEYATRTVRG